AGSRTTAMEIIPLAAPDTPGGGARRLGRPLGGDGARRHPHTPPRLPPPPPSPARPRVSVLRDVASLTLPRPIAAAQRALLAGAPGAVDGVHQLDLRLFHAPRAGGGQSGR